MEIDDLLDLVLEKVHSEPQHADKAVNERIVRADLYSLVEDYTRSYESYRINDLVQALERAEGTINGRCHE